MNIAFDWFMKFGMHVHDRRTVENVTNQSFVMHAKSVALDQEKKYIDDCVEFQLNHRKTTGQ